MFWSRIISGFTWPCFLLAILLQRTPVIRHLASIEFSIIPRAQHLWKWTAAAFTVGSYNTVTGASGDLVLNESNNDTTVLVGEELRLIVEVEGSKLLRPKTWKVEGDLPSGVIFEVKQELGVVVFHGIPTESGTFPITVRAWELANEMGDTGTPISFDIVVESVGPIFTSQPIEQTVLWGESLILSGEVETPELVTFQWQRILSGELEYMNIEGKNETTLSIERLLNTDAGMYRLKATNTEGSSYSDSALVSIAATPLQSWTELNFERPFSVEADIQADPDHDELANGLEFVFKLDPLTNEGKPIPVVSQEFINDTSYTVFKYPSLVASEPPSVSVEGSLGLLSENWTELTNGVDDVIIENEPEGFLVKIPSTQKRFIRIRVTVN